MNEIELLKQSIEILKKYTWHDVETDKPENDKEVLIAYCSSDEINNEDRNIYYAVSRYYEEPNLHYMKWHEPIQYFEYYTVLGWMPLLEYK